LDELYSNGINIVLTYRFCIPFVCSIVYWFITLSSSSSSFLLFKIHSVDNKHGR